MAAVLQSGYVLSITSGVQDNITLTAPTGISAGDLLLILVMDDADNTTGSLFDTPSGYTSVQTAGDGTSDTHTHVFSKIATGDETDTNITHGGVSDELIGWMLRVTGADSIGAVGTGIAQSGSNTLDIPSIITNSDDSLVFYVASFDGGDMLPTSVSGTGWTKIAEGAENTDGGTTGGVFGTNLVATSGTDSGIATVTMDTTDGAAGFQFEIKSKVGITADVGVYNTSGVTTGILYNRIAEINSEVYNTTGSAVSLEYNRSVGIISEAYENTGGDIILLHNKIINTNTGSYDTTGVDVTLKNNRLIINSEVYNTSLTDVILKVDRKISINTETYDISGSIVSISHNELPLAYKINMPIGWHAYNVNMPINYLSYKIKV